MLTNLTGFGFRFAAIQPSHVVAGLSLVVLSVAAFALYGGQAAWSTLPALL